MPKTNSPADNLRDNSTPTDATSPEADRRTGTEARKLVGAHFPEPVHRQLRVLAAQEGRTVQSVLAEALNDLFSKRQLPPVA